MMFLLGRQAMFGQEPPTYFRSTTAVLIPFLANVQEMSLPAAPLPNISRSYSSGLEPTRFPVVCFPSFIMFCYGCHQFLLITAVNEIFRMFSSSLLTAACAIGILKRMSELSIKVNQFVAEFKYSNHCAK